MQALATATAGAETSPGLSAAMKGIVNAYGDDYTVVELVDLTGKALSSSDPRANVEVTGQDWFHEVVAGHPVLTSISRVGPAVDHRRADHRR
jgi:hypothetical protein